MAMNYYLIECSVCKHTLEGNFKDGLINYMLEHTKEHFPDPYLFKTDGMGRKLKQLKIRKG